jgi:anaerobic dimethyl sulfoxide reductase subunit B (iron-sulfur subunit)
MTQLGFFFDMQRCTGCRCCQTACKDVHDLRVGEFYRKVTDYEGGCFPNVWAASYSLSCNHCKQPLCVANCPVAAIGKDPETGLVIQNQEMCIACERCVKMCPYHVPTYLPDRLVVGKCDACRSFLAIGEQPACVASCSTRALKFGVMEDLMATYGPAGLTSDLPILPDSSETVPSLLIRPKPEMLQEG